MHTVSPSREDHLETAERLWLKFFADPSQWWHNKSGKVNPTSQTSGTGLQRKFFGSVVRPGHHG